MPKRKLDDPHSEQAAKLKKEGSVKIEDGNVEEDEAKTDSAAGMFRNPIVKVEGQTKREASSSSSSGRKPEEQTIVCPYLDTIDRKVLDFDFEKLCSVSLSNLNVYACLVCGKYFQGRGHSTHAYMHALEADHHVFINLHTTKIYCLPDGYEVKDTSLNDIQYNLHPQFSKEQAKQLNTNTKFTHALDGTDYLPGVVGLNNTKKTDWLNVCVQSLLLVPPIRNYFLVEENYAKNKSPLVKAFGELICKMCNARNFKGHVSPHELLQAINVASDKKFKIGTQADPIRFMSWFLHRLHKDLGGTKKKNSSPIYQAFLGELVVYTDRPKPQPPGADPELAEWDTTETKKTFLYLSLALPPAPLFKDSMQTNMIPQVPMFDLLEKFDSSYKGKLNPDGTRTRYTITRMPRYLVFHIQRFSENNWFVEKNPTLVNFPIKNMDMASFTTTSVTSAEQLAKLPVATLKSRLQKRKIDFQGVVDKADLVELLHNSLQTSSLKKQTKYDLLANMCHDGKWEDGSYRAHVLHKPSDLWYELQDLHVWTTETMPQLVALSETYVQIYELQKPT